MAAGAALLLHLSPLLAAQATIPGGSWRSILPSGTERAEVRVSPYRLDRTPVTNGDFLKFVNAHPEWRRDRASRVMADSQYLSQWESATSLGPNALVNQPVTSVSWFAARSYCEARGERLPTWYEWEYAAAASETSADARQEPGWQQQILSWYSRPSSHPLERVGLHPANFYGVRDLHGLVWEWVEDFNALMISGDSRKQGDPDLLKFCGTGALALEDRSNYALAMRLALLSSLQANATTRNLGFRCAQDGPKPQMTATAATRTWPSDSLYQLDIPLERANGTRSSFAQTSGGARIVTFIYANCPMVCPLTVETLLGLDAALKPAERAHLDIMLVSMDPERDTPQALTQLARERHIPDKRWTLARASLPDTRKLAAALGIQYRALSDGDFQHSTVLVLLDAQGREVARTGTLGTPAPEFLAAVRAAAR
jgi:formylglycine-generating enzyme required for sulfatase activity